MENKLSLSETLIKASKSFFSQIWILAGLIIGYVIIMLSLNLFNPYSTGEAITFSGIIISSLSLLFSLSFALGYTKNLFQALDSEEPQFSAYGREARKIITYLLARIIYILIVSLGLVLLVVPGIYLGIRLQFYYTSIVDENMGIVDSLKRSWEITKGKFGFLFLLLIVIIGLNLVGLAVMGVGIFITYPLSLMMSCYVFRKLTAFYA